MHFFLQCHWKEKLVGSRSATNMVLLRSLNVLQKLRYHDVKQRETALQLSVSKQNVFTRNLVTMQTLRLLRSQKEHIFETEKTLNFAPKRTINIVAVLIALLLQKGFIRPQIGFKFGSIKHKKVSMMLHVCRNNVLRIGVKPSDWNETG